MYVEGVQERLAEKKDEEEMKELEYPILPAEELARLQREIDQSESKSVDDEDNGIPLEAAAERVLKDVELLERNRLKRERLEQE